MTVLVLPAPAVDCGICHAWPLNHCIGIDGLPLEVPHAQRGETTPIHDALLASTTSSTDSLPSRRRADAGTPDVAIQQPGRAAASARPRKSTRALTPTAGQGTPAMRAVR